MQLGSAQDAFVAIGVQVAAMSYDDPSVLAAFRDDNGLEFPLLSDVGGTHAKAWGVLNEEYAPGHPAYGIPHPGVVWVGADGVVRAKFARPDYKERPDFADVLDTLRAAIGAGPQAVDSLGAEAAGH